MGRVQEMLDLFYREGTTDPYETAQSKEHYVALLIEATVATWGGYACDYEAEAEAIAEQVYR